MKPSSAALKNYLASLGSAQPAIVADLLTWILVDGSVIRLSNFQTALTPPANSFQAPDGFGKGASVNYAATATPVSFPLGPPIGPVKWQVKIGTNPDTTTIDIYPRPPGHPDFPSGDLIGVYPWQQACLFRLFDGAILEIDRLFMPSPGDYSLGSFVLYSGRVADITLGRSKISMKVPSLLVLLSNMMPRRIFGAPCTHIFGDAMCQFDRSTMSVIFACTSSSGQALLNGGPSPAPGTLYNLGTAIGITGANIGIKRTVNNLAGGAVTLTAPYAFPVVVGDQFQLLPGCDHTVATCQNVFNNFVHFGGFPNIPPPEASL